MCAHQGEHGADQRAEHLAHGQGLLRTDGQGGEHRPGRHDQQGQRAGETAEGEQDQEEQGECDSTNAEETRVAATQAASSAATQPREGSSRSVVETAEGSRRRGARDGADPIDRCDQGREGEGEQHGHLVDGEGPQHAQAQQHREGQVHGAAQDGGEGRGGGGLLRVDGPGLWAIWQQGRSSPGHSRASGHRAGIVRKVQARAGPSGGRAGPPEPMWNAWIHGDMEACSSHSETSSTPRGASR